MTIGDTLAAVERDACEAVTVHHPLFPFIALKMAKDEKVCSAIKDFNAFYDERHRVHMDAFEDYTKLKKLVNHYDSEDDIGA